MSGRKSLQAIVKIQREFLSPFPNTCWLDNTAIIKDVVVIFARILVKSTADKGLILVDSIGSQLGGLQRLKLFVLSWVEWQQSAENSVDGLS